MGHKTHLLVDKRKARVKSWINKKLLKKLDYTLIEEECNDKENYSYEVICDFLQSGLAFVALNISPYEEETIDLISSKMKKKDQMRLHRILKDHGLDNLNQQELKFLANNLKRCLDQCDIIITSEKKAKNCAINSRVSSAKILIDDKITIDFFRKFYEQLKDKKILFVGESGAHNFSNLDVKVIPVALDKQHSFVEVFDELKLRVLTSEFDLMVTDIKLIGNLICDFAITLNKEAINLTCFY